MTSSNIVPPPNDWQVGRTALECHAYMLENEVQTDVSFCVGRKTSELEVIKAHRYMLAARSPVFYAMCYGGLASSDDVPISDTDADSFRHMLRYVIGGLVNLCSKFLTSILTVENVCDVFQQTYIFEDREFQNRCMAFITSKACDVFDTPSFLSLPRDCLALVLSRDHMLCDEVALFHAAVRWAHAQCEREGVAPDGPGLRAALGPALTHIRFPAMTLEDFANHVAVKDILTLEEESRVFRYFTAAGRPDPGFPRQPRAIGALFTCARFGAVSRSWNCGGRYDDALDVQVSRDVVLRGFGFYCGAGGLQVHVRVLDNGRPLAEKQQSVPRGQAGDSIATVLLPKMVRMRAGSWYTVTALLRGEPTMRGLNGQGTVEVAEADVTFTFKDSEDSTNGTDVSKGQLPQILFHL